MNIGKFKFTYNTWYIWNRINEKWIGKFVEDENFCLNFKIFYNNKILIENIILSPLIIKEYNQNGCNPRIPAINIKKITENEIIEKVGKDIWNEYLIGIIL